MINHKSWDINEIDTGKSLEGKPVMGATLQNGLNDIEPDGSFVPCDMGLNAVVDGVTTHRVKRGRYGELRFADTGSANKHLCKIKYKDGNGLSFKYIGGDSGLPDVSSGNPSFVADNGVIIEHTPRYNGVRIELVINDPLTAPLEYTFSMKTYGQNYTYIEQDGGIVARGEDLMPITIHAPYAVDANGDVGPVTMVLTEVVGGLQTFKKVVDETWFRQAAAPVRIDPNVTIDDTTGTLIDTFLSSYSAQVDYNYGVSTVVAAHKVGVADQTTGLMKVDLTAYSGITVTAARFGLDVYSKSGASYVTKVFEVLKTWIEGTKSGAAASLGEPTWNSQIHNLNPAWSSGGCQGSGTDHNATEESSTTVTAVNSDVHFTLTNATVQGHIDTPASNNGYVWISQDLTYSGASWIARSSQATLGNIPYFYMEYTIGAAWHPFFFDEGHR